jgi:iron(III) transport system substrate-binding protein
MKKTFLKNRFRMAGLLIVFVLFGCSKSDAPQSAGKAETLVLYSTMTENDLTNLLKGFNEKYPAVTVEVVTGGTGELLSRIKAEAHTPQGDLMWGGLSSVDGDTYSDLFEHWLSVYEGELMEDYRSTNGFYNLSQLQTVCFIVNTDLEKELGLTITSYADLLNPALKGKIVSADPNSSSSAWSNVSNIMAVFGNDSPAAWAFIEALVKNDLVIVSSSSLTYKGPTDGEYVVGLSYDDGASSQIKSGAKNVRLVYPSEGTSAIGFGSAIIKGAPHAETAKRLINYIMSAEGQAYLGSSLGTFRGTNKNASYQSPYIAASASIKWVKRDVPWLIENKAKVLARWNQIVTSKGN